MKKLCPICKNELPPTPCAGKLCPHCDTQIIYVILRGPKDA